MLPGEQSGSRGPRQSSLLLREEDFLLPEIDIGLDADGNFIEFDNIPQAAAAQSGGRQSLASGSAARGGTREEQEAGQRASATLAVSSSILQVCSTR